MKTKLQAKRPPSMTPYGSEERARVILAALKVFLSDIEDDDGNLVYPRYEDTKLPASDEELEHIELFITGIENRLNNPHYQSARAEKTVG